VLGGETDKESANEEWGALEFRVITLNPMRACSVLPQSIWIEGIEGVLIPGKSKSPLIHINPLQSIWIENNRTSP
jgi:hypothetical protein